MEPVTLFDLATKQAQWLSVRQSAIAGNIANANTPGYTADDVEPFEKVLDQHRACRCAPPRPAISAARRPMPASPSSRRKIARRRSCRPKNTVVLENELMKAGEVRRSFELNTAIVKAFHSHDDDGGEELTPWTHLPPP